MFYALLLVTFILAVTVSFAVVKTFDRSHHKGRQNDG